jgi:hypothetical protein
MPLSRYLGMQLMVAKRIGTGARMRVLDMMRLLRYAGMHLEVAKRIVTAA